MAIYISNIMIAILREKRGYSQEKLAELVGCNTATISRIESNKIANPDKRTIENIFNALKVDHKRFVSLLSNDLEREIDEKKQLISDSIRMRNFGETEALLLSLENDKRLKKDKFVKQYLYRVKATILINQKEKAYTDILEMLYTAIRLTVEDFDIESIENNLYSFEEYNVINTIAGCLAESGELEKAVKIMYALKHCLEKNYIPRMDRANFYIMVLYNLSKFLGLLKRHEESIAICDIAITECIATQTFKNLPSVEYNKAYNLFYLGQLDESLSLYKKVLVLCEEHQNKLLAVPVKKDLKEKFNLAYNVT